MQEGRYRGDDASELRLGRVSSILVGGCNPTVSGRDSKTLGPIIVGFSHKPRCYLDHGLVTWGEVTFTGLVFQSQRGQKEKKIASRANKMFYWGTICPTD